MVFLCTCVTTGVTKKGQIRPNKDTNLFAKGSALTTEIIFHTNFLSLPFQLSPTGFDWLKVDHSMVGVGAGVAQPYPGKKNSFHDKFWNIFF